MRPLLTRTSTVFASPDQLSCDMDGEAVILGLRASVYYSLNPVGTRIWELVQAPVQVDQLISRLRSEYEVDNDRCEQEVTQLLRDLAEAGLIEIRAATAA